MATLREYFDTDFRNSLNVAKPLTVKSSGSDFSIEVQARLHLDFDSNAKFISCYIPAHPDALSVIVALLQQLKIIFDFMNDIEIHGGFHGERLVNAADLRFTGRVYLYCESDIPDTDLERLGKDARDNGLSLCIRGNELAMERSRLQKPQAFICHDTRDKAAVARPIAVGLSKLMCPVWFDEFSLKVGDPLRESIEKGLKECKKCVIVLSPNFFSNTGWTKVEFNSIFTRELLERTELVLPVWVDVSKEEVYNYSPSLADRVGVNWSLGVDEVVRRLFRVLQ